MKFLSLTAPTVKLKSKSRYALARVFVQFLVNRGLLHEAINNYNKSYNKHWNSFEEYLMMTSPSWYVLNLFFYGTHLSLHTDLHTEWMNELDKTMSEGT